jgi:hypothetical protein
MSTKEKENFISLVSGIVVSIPYLIYVILRYQDSNFTTEEELKFWATAVLILIPIRIVSIIIMYVTVAIVNAIVTGEEDVKDLVDERDRLIELKANRNSYIITMVGFGLGIASLAFGGSVTLMFGIFIIFGFVAELVSFVSNVYYYRKGV